MAAEAQGWDETNRYRALLARDPNSRAFGQLADAYRRQGRYTDAIAVCAKGLRRYPNYVSARLVLARALAAHGDAPRAEAEFRRILELTPDDVLAHRGLGDLLRGQGHGAEALAAYEALLELTPFDADVRELVEGLTAPAIPAAAAPAAPTASPDPLATETLADLYVQQGFLDDARAIYDELVRVEPARADLQAKLASLKAARPTPAAVDETGVEPAGLAALAATGPAAGRDDLVTTLEAWLGAARDLRMERSGR